MNWPWLRGLMLLLVFDIIAVFVSGRAAMKALSDRDLVWAGVFGLIAATYVLGLVLGLIRHRLADPVNDRLRAAGIYLFAAFTTAVTADDLMYISAMSGRPFSGLPRLLLNTSLIGSLVMALAVLAVLIKPRYGYFAALFGGGLLCPYFVLLAWNLPWHDFVWLVTIHWDGKLQVLAVISLAVAMAYSIRRLWRTQKSIGLLKESEIRSGQFPR